MAFRKNPISRMVTSRVRNELPMWAVIPALDRDGPPSKVRDGRFVFLCPSCGEMLVAVNPRNNLAHCFGCGRNFNTIDLLLACEYDFRGAVAQLEVWLEQYRSERSRRWATDPDATPPSGM